MRESPPPNWVLRTAIGPASLAGQLAVHSTPASLAGLIAVRSTAVRGT